ncbi:MAG: cbb3-type cytochrome c oxidase subunit I [Hyphomonadaceae bacterium]
MSDTVSKQAVIEPHATAVKLTMLISGAVFALMMLIGVIMRASQGGLIDMNPAFFYQLLTVHGTGMVGTAGFSGAGIMWYFLGRHVPLSKNMYYAFMVLFLLGVVCILSSTMIGGFGGMWTFLFPLPAAQAGAAWPVWAAATFMLGYVLIGVGFLLYYLAVGLALIRKYGGLGRALGWHIVFGRAEADDAPPPTVIAAAAVTVFNTLGTVVGAAVLIASLINLYQPGFEVDALLAKNMTYFFGHVFINAALYMAVIAVYELLPEYTGRPWKSSKPFILAWSAILLFVLAVYPHHLMQDMVMPAWMIVMGQIVSYLSGVPLLAVTAFSMMVYMYGAKFKWDLASSLLVLGVAGWTIGAVPAIIDGMVVVNKVMHNTQWVPGHFHIYLLVGQVGMSFGFMAWLVKDKTRSSEGLGGLDKVLLTSFAAGSAAFTLMFLVSGALSVPRRWAIHWPEWFVQDRIATVAALVVVLSVLTMLIRYATGLARSNET